MLGIPSVTKAANICIKAGANGITVHPRPDARHIRAQDVYELSEIVKAQPGVEFNIEGNPFHNLMGFVRDVRPDQVTFVPDSEGQLTSDHGWQFPADLDRLKPMVDEALGLGVRVSLFMDAQADQMHFVKTLGAQRVELYTEPYAATFATPNNQVVLQKFINTAQKAMELGIELNAGHDLNLSNLPTLLSAIPQIREVSIGHALISDALEMGYEHTVKAYLACIKQSTRT